jgi:hypothetical protein
MCERRVFMTPIFMTLSEGAGMLAAVAVVLFVIGFIVNAANVATPALFSPTSFLLAGLVCLAIHLTGAAPAWSMPRRRR